MKTELKAKFLQHLSQKKQDQGFTLIELLVVIIIIGILSAIALPSFLNQANKAKQTEAKTYVGSMNRAQQTYFLEQGEFAGSDDFGALGLGIPKDTANYLYDIEAQAANPPAATNKAAPQNNGIKAYIGGVQLGVDTDTSEATTLAILCEAETAFGLEGAADGTETASFDDGGEPSCPGAGYKELGAEEEDGGA